MKYRFTILCLALALLLSGCGIITDKYESVSPHTSSSPQSAGDAIKKYTDLQDALIALIHEGTEETTLTTDAYSGDLEEDFVRLENYLMREDPESAYVVSGISKEIVRAGSYYKINLEMHYQHQYDELKSAKTVHSMDSVLEKVIEALEDCDETLLLDVHNYEKLDYNAAVKEYCENNLTTVMAQPEVQESVFPDSERISRRIVELRFVYPMTLNSAELRNRKTFVSLMIDFAKNRVIDEPSELERARLLYVQQFAGYSYTEESAATPAFALFIDRKADSRAFSAVYEAMCRAAEVNCTTVHGTRNGEPYDWNILELESGVWHVDVNADAQSGLPELRLLTDAEMEGYEWDTASTPACVGFFEPVVPPQEEQTEGETPEQPEEPAPEPEPGPEPPEENPDEPENTP